MVTLHIDVATEVLGAPIWRPHSHEESPAAPLRTLLPHWSKS